MKNQNIENIKDHLVEDFAKEENKEEEIKDLEAQIQNIKIGDDDN